MKATRCLFIVGVLLCPLQSWAQVCDEYAVGYFNGIANTLDDAQSSLQAIRSLVGQVAGDKRIKYEVFYNPSEGHLLDMAETFVQNADDIDRSGVFRERFELLWESISGNERFWGSLIALGPVAFETARDIVVASVITTAAQAIDSPVIEDVVQNHVRLLADFAQDDDKVLLIGHSQGNSFANAVFDRVGTRFGVDGIEVVHVAPGSPTLRGVYQLADIDLVIAALESMPGIGYQRSRNLVLPPSVRDWSGHRLVETYLDGNRPGRVAIGDVIRLELDSLSARC